MSVCTVLHTNDEGSRCPFYSASSTTVHLSCRYYRHIQLSLIIYPAQGHGRLSSTPLTLHVMQLLRTSEDQPLNRRPLWDRSDLDASHLVNEFQRECHVVRRSIDGDLVKVHLLTQTATASSPFYWSCLVNTGCAIMR